jgi:hypothetical protein
MRANIFKSADATCCVTSDIKVHHFVKETEYVVKRIAM